MTARAAPVVNAAAVRLHVDAANKTKPADVGRYGLHLQLKNVANGKHTYKIVIRDFAGNKREVTRTFTVAVPDRDVRRPHSTRCRPPPPRRPSRRPRITQHQPHRRRSTTLYPTPTTSASPYYPTPTPTTSGSPIVGAPISSASPGAGAGGSGDGGGSSAGFLAGTLLAMLPLGAALTYYLLHRREDAMAGASAGEALPGGGSGWERTKDTFSKSGDIIKPARS